MALINGFGEAHERAVSPVQHLGKRKRTPSTEPESNVANKAQSTKQTLRDGIQFIQQRQTSTIVLTFPLPTRGYNDRVAKKRRFDISDNEHDTIGSRITRDEYESLDDLLYDVTQIKSTIEVEETNLNGIEEKQTRRSEQVQTLLDELSRFQASSTGKPATELPTSNGYEAENVNAPTLPSSQVLSLRSQTEHGIRQLFSGLLKVPVSLNLNGRKLPNGFELTEALNFDKNDLHGKDGRKFGDVFSSPHNTKTLEMPRANRPPRTNTLGFIKPFENVPNPGKSNFKFANLNTGLWLRYDIAEKPDDKTTTSRPDDVGKADSLFKAAFSTFAPSIDDSQSMVTTFDKSQQWWKNAILPSHTQKVFATTSQTDLASERTDHVSDVSDKDLEEMVASYISDEEESDESDVLLTEIAELIETLASYQTLRSLEVARGPSSSSKPSNDEQNKYEMLRDQLQLLVSSLPPFAVAKLDGDQLEDLNISTHIVIEAPEFVGTAQSDEYTMRQTRAVQVATAAAARNPAPMQSRAPYSTPASAYNAQARAYNSVSTSTYTARPPNAAYNTPRPATTAAIGAYPQSQYRPNGPAIHTPSIQQFQRPMVNGYGSTATPGTHSPYLQRPSQPGYQQRAQDHLSYNRTETPQKAVINGDVSQYQNRQYATPSVNPAANTPNTIGQRQLPADSIKQRQPSATPQPQPRVVDGIGVASS